MFNRKGPFLKSSKSTISIDIVLVWIQMLCIFPKVLSQEHAHLYFPHENHFLRKTIRKFPLRTCWICSIMAARYRTVVDALALDMLITVQWLVFIDLVSFEVWGSRLTSRRYMPSDYSAITDEESSECLMCSSACTWNPSTEWRLPSFCSLK